LISFSRKSFCVCSKDLDSLTHMAFVHDVYDLLCASPYRENVEVKMLGQMLTSYYETARRKQP